MNFLNTCTVHTICTLSNYTGCKFSIREVLTVCGNEVLIACANSYKLYIAPVRPHTRIHMVVFSNKGTQSIGGYGSCLSSHVVMASRHCSAVKLYTLMKHLLTPTIPLYYGPIDRNAVTNGTMRTELITMNSFFSVMTFKVLCFCVCQETVYRHILVGMVTLYVHTVGVENKFRIAQTSLTNMQCY